ncbi:unnamed protein product [Ectocarpus sp. 4 AP-2014]
MPVEDANAPQSGWRMPQDDDHDGHGINRTDKKKHNKKHKAKIATPAVPSRNLKSTRTTAVVVAGGGEPALAAGSGASAEGDDAIRNGGGSDHESRKHEDLAKSGATRRKQNGLNQVVITHKLTKHIVKETRKKIIAREKAEQSERKLKRGKETKGPDEDDEESEDGIDPTAETAWLQPETRVARVKAKRMRGLRTNSVENLENDDLNHLSAQRTFAKTGLWRCPNPFGRKLIEDRQELLGILNMPRNKRMRKAGIKESHLASIVDVYRNVMFNALARIEEDEAGDAGPLVGAKKADDKGVRVSLFTAALGISPYLFMREASRRWRWVLWASNRLYAHAVAGEMNRATWVFGCIGLCLMSEKEVVEFIFNTCKVTQAGELEVGELDRLAKSLHLSNDAFWPAFSQQLEDINKSHQNGDLIMTLDFFQDMHHKYPMILYPALRVQELVQRRTLGLRAWGRLNDRLDNYLVRQKRNANTKPCCLWVLLGLK